ncbi:glycosyltransferase family 4 protein [Aquirufa antheringensis]|uniref:glycosyltransferase family 4 protein n=1 Tax=Aquirufa antheringensis TaxID=2516559 RepID=UPI003BAF904D
MKIKYFPYQPHCFAFGGFDLQMLNALKAVSESGLNVTKLDIWSADKDFDILHLWGLGPHNYQIIDWSKKAKKKIVVTLLLPYFDTVRLKLSYFKNFLTSNQKQYRYYLNLIDRLVVVNELQLVILNKYYNVPIDKIDVIPNIVEERYFELPNFDFSKKYNIENYILCTGNISPRKNQLNLTKACIQLKLNLVLIGNVLDGEVAYANELESIVQKNENIRWIKGLPNASNELVSAYYHCLAFALPSVDETQPISALEASAMGKPLLMLDRKYAHQKYYNNVTFCRSESVSDIVMALLNFSLNTAHVSYNRELQNCRQENVGNLYKGVYEVIHN